MSQKVVLLIVLLALKSLYVPLNRRMSRYYWKLPIDDHIPLLPIFVIPYLAYYPYIIITYIFLWNTVFIMPFLIAMTIAYVTAVIFWYFVPNGVKRPVVAGSTIFDRILAKIYAADEDTNGFPSAHVFVAILCAYGLWMLGGQFQWISLATAAAIVASTVFTKQHYVLDIVGGIVVAVLAILLSFSAGIY